MLPHRWQPLGQLVAARMREFAREPHAIFWVYGMPLVLATVLGVAFRSVKPPPPHVDVLATRNPEVAKQVASTLEKNDFKVEIHDREECEKRLTRGDSVMYVAITGSTEYEFVYDPANKEATAARYWTESLLLHKYANVTTTPLEPKSPGARYVQFLLPGLIGTNIMGGGLFGLGFLLVDMRVRKLFKRLVATPMRHSDFLLAMVASRLLLLIPEMTCILTIGYFAFDLEIRGSILTLALVIFCGAATFSGIGLLIGSRTEKTETATGLINFTMVLPQWLLSGVFFSSSNFPDAAQPFINALPLTQLIKALREVILEGKGLLDVSGRLAILLAYAVVAYVLALRWFKWR
ncbi:MAG TPA: ABC transporter permease [Gemmataceae bacterium]|nr:ABC transporter permease [Gemmataceae bacterium]